MTRTRIGAWMTDRLHSGKRAARGNARRWLFRFGPLLPLLVGAAFASGVWLISSETANATHSNTINGEWTCSEGGLEIGGAVLDPGNCFDHWSWADNRWHFLSEVPSSQRAVIRPSTGVWESGHALNFIEDSSAASHVHWTTSAPCSIACVTQVTLDIGGTANDHIETFQVYFNSSQSWNTSGGASHGTFDGKWDLKGVATHELGHAAGLGHSTTGDDGHSGYNNAVVATMCSPGSTCMPKSHTEYRDLHTDDITGRCQIYYHAHGYSC